MNKGKKVIMWHRRLGRQQWWQRHRKGRRRWYDNDRDSDSYNSTTIIGGTGAGGDGDGEEINTIEIQLK